MVIIVIFGSLSSQKKYLILLFFTIGKQRDLREPVGIIEFLLILLYFSDTLRIYLGGHIAQDC